MSTALIRWRRAAAVVAALALSATGVTATSGPALADADCLAVETYRTDWTTGPGTGGYQHTIVITNSCDTAVTGWTLSLTLPGGTTFQQGWNANWTVAGSVVTVTPPSWSSVLRPGGSLSVGLIGAWTGSPRPAICRINDRPCDQPPGEETAPQVTLTAPVERSGSPTVCALPMTAKVDPGTATVDRVEFYINGQLVGADGSAPYGIEVPADHPAFNASPYEHTAFARVVTTSSATADSPTTTFQRAVHPPALMAIACQSRVEVIEGGTATVTFVTVCSGTPGLRLTVTGDAGVSVTPDFSPPGAREHRITIAAAPGSAGATARITATPEPTGCLSGSTQVVVTPA